MSITNALYKKKFNPSFFEKNSPLAQLINTHNKFIDLYASGGKTEDGLNLVVSLNDISNSFYQDLDIQNVITHCAQLQKNLEALMQDLEKAQQLGRLKDSYWANMLKSDRALFATITSVPILGGLLGGGGYLALGITDIALYAVPILFVGMGIIVLTTLLISAAWSQYQAGLEYTKQYPQFCSSKENPNSFFDAKKSTLEQEIKAIEVPVSFDQFR